MKRILELLNLMKEQGLIADYALGGATALVHYFEPIQTQDIDVFITLAKSESNTLVNLAPIYSFLADHGAQPLNDYVLINNVPVQFLVPYNLLVEEAVTQATTAHFMGVSIRIPDLEHLMAIMLQTNRPKDRSRLEELKKHPELFDRQRLQDICSRHQLLERFTVL